jgi:hypothetical protein
LTTFSRALPSQSTSLSIGQAFLFCPHKRLLLNEHALSLVALAGAAKANHYGT